MNIVVLTKNFGMNYTGATVATNNLTNKWCNSRDVGSVHIIARNFGEFTKHEKLIIHKFKNYKEAIEIISSLDSEENIFYSDDHYGVLLAVKHVNYVHTYHGNWPDAKYIDYKFFIKSIYFIPLYAFTIKNAKTVVNVSKYMEKFTARYNKSLMLIRNGVNEKTIYTSKKSKESFPKKVLMIGGIDGRKYGKLKKILPSLNKKIHIDIYGNFIDDKIVKFLQNEPQVTLKGFIDFNEIEFENYGVYLSVSTIENLPISIVEIIKQGMPVMAYDVGGISEIVNTSNGVLLDKKEKPDVICQKLYNIIFGKDEFTQDKSLDEFDWTISSQKYLTLFRKIYLNTRGKCNDNE